MVLAATTAKAATEEDSGANPGRQASRDGDRWHRSWTGSRRINRFRFTSTSLVPVPSPSLARLPPLPIPLLILLPTTRTLWPTFIHTSKPKKKNNKNNSRLNQNVRNQSPSRRLRWRYQNLSSPLLVLLVLSVPTAGKRRLIPSLSMIQRTPFLTQDRHLLRQHWSRLWIRYPCRQKSPLPSRSCSLQQPRLSSRCHQYQRLPLSTSPFPRCQPALTPSLNQKRRRFTSLNSCYRP